MSVLKVYTCAGLLLSLFITKPNVVKSFHVYQGKELPSIDHRKIRDVGEQSTLPAESSFDYNYTINVDPENNTANDSQDCYPPEEGGMSNIPCRTLDFALQFHPQNSVKFLLASANAVYPLMTSVTFSNVEDVAIFGSNQSYPQIPIIECRLLNEAGLAFINSNNIVLKSVRFLYCGALRNSTSKDFSAKATNGVRLLQFKVTLYFNNCTNIEMCTVQVDNSFQATGVVMYNTIGKVSVNMCKFRNNQVDGSKNLFGGGGFAVEFTYCQPGDNVCNNKNYNTFGRKNHNARYLFTNCIFSDNRALGQSLKSMSSSANFIIPLNTTHESFGRGGGLSVYFKGDATNNTIIIENCHFIHNRAVWGGGLLVEMDDNTINNTVVIAYCFFKHNHCNFTEEYGTGGGALRIATTVYFWDYSYKNRNTTGSIIRVENCTFIHNKALEGGALSIALARQGKSHDFQVTKISISYSTFHSNFGRIGSAAKISLHPLFIEGYLSRVQFTNCTFSNNSIQFTNKSKAIHLVGMGAVYVSGIQVDFSDTAKFINNSGSAVVVVGTQVDFSGCNAVFSMNSGSNGGGIALLGVALLLIGHHTRMNFTDNYVSGYGGAIYNRYIGQENMKSNINCFMRYEDPFTAPENWKVRFYFKNNTAKKLGNSIYSSSILPCSLAGHNFVDKEKIFCWNKTRWTYDSSECHCQIYTSAHNFTLTNMKSDQNIYPGRDFNLQLEATDNLGHNVTKTTVYSASVFSQYKFAQVDPRFTYIADNYITINGQPEQNFSIQIETATSPQVHIKMDLKMKKCPPGFKLWTYNLKKSKTGQRCADATYNHDNNIANVVCQCINKHSYRGNLRCYAEDWSSQISTRFWIGFDLNQDQQLSNYSDLLMGYFPPIYSLHRKRAHSFIILSESNHKALDKKICGGEHRTGVLCGKCVEGFAVAVNSPYFECVPCNGTSAGEFFGYFVGYVALTYIPILILLFIIFYFNIKLTSSAAFGFVLYAQMISSGIFNITGGKASYLDIGSFPHIMQRMYRTVYGVFNLDSLANLLPSFCLNKKFTTLDVICLDYATAAFPLIIIVITHFVYRFNLMRCKCSSRKSRTRIAGNETSSIDTRLLRGTRGSSSDPQVPRKSLIHTFIAFVLLSYTKFSLAAMSSLYTTQLFNAEGTTITASRIYLAGHLSLQSRHYLLPYGLLAIFVFIFIVLLPPLLLLGPLQFMDWLLERPGFHYLHKVWPSIAVHTFLDTFQGFYKPNRRFFAGIYFLFRLVVFLSFCFAPTAVLRYSIQQIVTLIMIVLISILQPHKTNLFNHVDTLLFFNLSILNAFALYTIANNTTNYFSMATYVFECTLVWSPLVYMACYVAWSCIHNSKYYPKITALCQQITTRFRGRESQPLLQEITTLQLREGYHELTDSFTDADKGMFKRAEGKNTYRPTTTIVNKRTDGGKRVVETTVVSMIQYNSEMEHTGQGEGAALNETSCSEDSGTGLLSNTSNISTSL